MTKLAIVITLIALTAFGNCKCTTEITFFKIIRSDFKNQIREKGSYEVVICPGESVMMGWAVQNAPKATIQPGGMTAEVPAGFVELKPATDTEYTLTAEWGECRTSKSVKAIVVTPDKMHSVTATQASRAPWTWEAQLLPQFYSPQILATSGQMQSPPTQSNWTGNKSDLNSNSHTFTLTAAGPANFTSFGPPPWQLAGNWKIGPLLQTEVSDNAPGTASFVLRLRCEGQ